MTTAPQTYTLDSILMLASALIVLGSFAAFSFMIIRDQVRDHRRRNRRHKMILGKCYTNLDYDPYPVSKDLLSVSKKYKKDCYMTNREKAKEYSKRRKGKDTDRGFRD